MTPGPGIFRTTLPKGFLASGINCGVRRYRPDIGLIVSEAPCVAAGVFTQNTCRAAPVRYCEQLLPSDNIRAIFTNSGQANAATGKQGVTDNQTLADTVASALECDASQILLASTGVIGEPMAMPLITAAIPELVKHATPLAEKFATAILTTDLVPKTINKTITLKNGQVKLTGICKGSGMIHPNMATMLGYFLSDVQLTKAQAQQLVKEATDVSFNMISVDGETSTNDCVFLMANGQSSISLEDEKDVTTFKKALIEVAIELAKSIARDGEGATKLIEVHIKGAPEQLMANTLARSLTISPLIKTAIHGASPNWGRIIARLGHEQLRESLLDTCAIYFQNACVYKNGEQQILEPGVLKSRMKEDSVNLVIELNGGTHSATAWGCDLSERYVKINAEYVT